MSYMKRWLENMICVQVWLNERDDGLNFLRGFTSDDPLRLALTYYVDPAMLDDPNKILNQAFHELNVDDPAAEWAQDYRRDRNRSLSVGDVVVIGEAAWACEPIGWKQVSLRAENCSR